VQLSLQINEPQIERLNKLEMLTGRTKSFYITEAINHYLDDWDDVQSAEQTLLNIRSGNEQVVSWEDLKGRNGI
jgi:RHH-type rel operon transcriptional repressor/antitoxin RelB